MSSSPKRAIKPARSRWCMGATWEKSRQKTVGCSALGVVSMTLPPGLVKEVMSFTRSIFPLVSRCSMTSRQTTRSKSLLISESS